MDDIGPLAAARSAPPGCSPRRTSCPGTGARSSRGSSAGSPPAACGRTCTAPLVCTESQWRSGKTIACHYNKEGRGVRNHHHQMPQIKRPEYLTSHIDI